MRIDRARIYFLRQRRSLPESEETRAYRICDESSKVDGKCPLDSMIDISVSQAAKLRFRVIALHAAIRLKLAIFAREWDAYPLGFETPVMPFMKNELEKFEEWPSIKTVARLSEKKEWVIHSTPRSVRVSSQD